MKNFWLVGFVLFALASHVWADGTFADAEEEQKREEQRRREKVAEERRNQELLIDGGWSDSPLHVFAYGLVDGEFDKFGFGFGFDWQLFRNFAWTFMNTDFYNNRWNASTLAKVVWRPYSFEVTAFAGIGVSLCFDEEDSDPKFPFMYGGSIGYNIGPESGVISIGLLFSEVHDVSISIGYKY